MKISENKSNFETCLTNTILTVRKAGHLNIKSKIFDFEAHVPIGWPEREKGHLRILLKIKCVFSG